MRIGGSSGALTTWRATGRALVPVEAVSASASGTGDARRDGFDPRAGDARGTASMPSPGRWQAPLLAQILAGREEAQRATAERATARTAPQSRAGRAYGEALKRVHRLEPGSLLARAL